MEPIISPWLIYALAIVDGVNISCGILGVFSGVLLLFIVAFYIMVYVDDDTDMMAKMKPIVKYVVLFFIFTSGIALFCPNQKTVIAMLVADQITYDRAEAVVDGAKDFKNTLKQDVLDIVLAITEKDKKED